MDGVDAIQADIGDVRAVRNVFSRVRPDAVIHCAAISQPNECEKNPALSHSVNVGAACAIAGLCAERRCACVFTSTDQVFDGEHAPYDENAAVAPLHHYGRQKAEAERRMRELYPATTICRLPLMFGPPSPSSHGFFQSFIAALKMGDRIRLFTDEIRTPAFSECVARGIFLSLRYPAAVLHLGGRERLSRYEFGLLMCEAFGLNKNLIVPSLRADVPLPAPRPRDLSLDSTRAYALGYNPCHIREALERFKNVQT